MSPISDNAFRVPELPIGEPERLWIRTAYELLRNGTRVNERAIRTRLYEYGIADQIPRDFRPWTVDERLIMPGGAVTLLGAWHVDPDNSLISEADEIIHAVKRLVFSDETREAVTADELARQTGLPVERVALLLHLVTPLGYFSAGFSYTEGVPGSIKLQRLSHPDVIREYARYDSIERLLQEFVDRRDSKRLDTVIAGSGKPATASKQTRVDQILERIKNHRVAAVIIVVGIIAGALVTWLGGLLALIQPLLGL